MVGMLFLFLPFKACLLPFSVNFHLEVVAGRIHLQRFYTISSIYLPPNTPVDREELYYLFCQLLSSLPPHFFFFLVLGDFHRRHPLWGGSVTNPRGIMLAAAVHDLDLCILNSGEHQNIRI